MGSVGSPKSWAPYDSYSDCSQRVCSSYCPQRCFNILPPPPPDYDDDSGPNFSPLIIAIITILASALLFVTFCTIFTAYRRRRRRRDRTASSTDVEANRDETPQDQWRVSSSAGPDEAIVKTIKVFKYKKGDGVVEGTECSVCLADFQEDENLRLLPKCSHAFHLNCIDTWLKSQPSCPICRANVASDPSPVPPAHPAPTSQNNSN